MDCIICGDWFVSSGDDKTCPACRKAANRMFPGMSAEHLLELVQAENDGRLVVLPCKIGDTVYVIPSKANYGLNIISGHPENNRVYEQPVREIRFYKGGVFLMMTCDGTQSVHSSFFGVTWFLTREAAEAALEEEHDD